MALLATIVYNKAHEFVSQNPGTLLCWRTLCKLRQGVVKMRLIAVRIGSWWNRELIKRISILDFGLLLLLHLSCVASLVVSRQHPCTLTVPKNNTLG